MHNSVQTLLTSGPYFEWATPCYSKCHPRTHSGIPQGLPRNADSQAPPQTHFIRNIIFYKILRQVFKVSWILISHLNAFFSAITLCGFFFFSLITLLRLSVAKWNISLGKCHIALGNMWVIFKFFWYWFLTEFHSDKRTDCMISIPSDHETFAPCFTSRDMSSASWFIILE